MANGTNKVSEKFLTDAEGCLASAALSEMIKGNKKPVEGIQYWKVERVVVLKDTDPQMQGGSRVIVGSVVLRPAWNRKSKSSRFARIRIEFGIDSNNDVFRYDVTF